MPDALIALDGVAAGYGGVHAVHGLSLEIEPGTRAAVIGPNGAGKTTLFRLLTGELEPRFGTVSAPRCALVPQTDRSRLDYPVSALDVALMGAVARLPWWRRPARADRTAALAALERLGLGEHARRTFGVLSGGQRQRVLVARALVADAPVLLLDEPFNGLDEPSAALLTTLLDELAAEGRAVLIATHDLDHARAADRVLCLNRRQVAFGAPEPTLTREVIEQTYGAAIVPVPGAGEAILPAHHHDHGRGA